MGKLEEPAFEVDPARDHVDSEGRTQSMHVESETVREHRDLGAGSPERADERPEAGIERDFGRRAQQQVFIRGQVRPLQFQALA
jgi:hypothetical protein